ncbi:MAG: DUF2284 domain-containing protein [Clostridia bacterium]|nr:DUF2284 domain-containing protein [Clostridia bacterium]
MAYFEKEITVKEFFEEFVDIPKFIKYCRECGNYNNVWSCPPYSFDVEEYWKQFRTVLVIADRFYPEKDLNYIDAWKALFERKKILFDYTLGLEKEHEGSVLLTAGGCHMCESCARKDGLPCRNPELIRYSVESLGGDVGKVVKNLFDIDIKWAAPGEVQEYMVLCGGLLKK